MKATLKRAVSGSLRRLLLTARARFATVAPNRAWILALLGIREDEVYARARLRQRDEILGRLRQCSPADSTPEAMSGYLEEAALRFGDTMEWIESSLTSLGGARPRLLEIGSNPYFLTLLIAERFPGVEHLGVNYFGAATPRMETQAITDARNRLKETRFFHADVERHDLAPAGQFDIALFCEVLEHLPYDPAWALHNIARRLRPGGHLILTTPNPARFENIVRLVERRETFSDPISGHGIHGRHNREYSADELRDLLAGSGFRVMEAKTIDTLPVTLSRGAEARGYGAYHMIRGVLESEPRLFRPAWLYRSFHPDDVARPRSLAPP